MRDFLRDEFFIKLVRDPDEDTRHYWQKWLEKNPEMISNRTILKWETKAWGEIPADFGRK